MRGRGASRLVGADRASGRTLRRALPPLRTPIIAARVCAARLVRGGRTPRRAPRRSARWLGAARTWGPIARVRGRRRVAAERSRSCEAFARAAAATAPHADRSGTRVRGRGAWRPTRTPMMRPAMRTEWVGGVHRWRDGGTFSSPVPIGAYAARARQMGIEEQAHARCRRARGASLTSPLRARSTCLLRA